MVFEIQKATDRRIKQDRIVFGAEVVFVRQLRRKEYMMNHIRERAQRELVRSSVHCGSSGGEEQAEADSYLGKKVNH